MLQSLKEEKKENHSTVSQTLQKTEYVSIPAFIRQVASPGLGLTVSL